MTTTYTMPANPYDDWRGCEYRGFVLSARQELVIAAVRQCANEGLRYADEVQTRCRALLNPSADELAVNINKVDGGWFGMDVYYARKYIDQAAKYAAEDAANTALNATAGMALGQLMFNDYKLTRAVSIINVDDKGIWISGSRGTAKIVATVSAMQIKHAMDRAFSYKKRPADFAGFTA